MANNPGALDPARTTAPNAAYPYGSSKDESSVGAGDGTPYKLQRANDIFGFQQAILSEASITPSGNADTALVSEYLNGLKKILKRDIAPVTASVAASALTLGLDPFTLDFRDPTLTSGNVNARLIDSALSLIVPSGATLGTIDTIQSRLILLAIDNAGTIKLAVVNLSGGVNLDETTLITTVAIDATADSNNVIYSDAVYTNVPFRIVGLVESTQATAGIWATTPTLLQGAGGNALTAMSSLGYGQTWQDVTGSRVFDTTYYNTTGKPIQLSINLELAASDDVAIVIDGVTIATTNTGATTSYNQVFNHVIPPGSSYRVNDVAVTPDLIKWFELR